MDRGREKVYHDLIELIERIAEYIFVEEDSVKEGIGDIMGGKVLELQSDKLIKKGREEGIKALVESYHEDEIPKDKLRIRLIEKFDFTEAEAQNYIERYWKE